MARTIYKLYEGKGMRDIKIKRVKFNKKLSSNESKGLKARWWQLKYLWIFPSRKLGKMNPF